MASNSAILSNLWVTLQTCCAKLTCYQSSKNSITFPRRVTNAGGIIPLYVHLDYADDIQVAQGQILTTYQNRSDTEVTSFLAREAPIVVFQDRGKTHPLPIRLQKTARGTLYVVEGDPTPIDGSWDDVGRVLHAAHVNEIQLGGTHADQCVKLVADELNEQGFNITFPLALFPQEPPMMVSRRH